MKRGSLPPSTLCLKPRLAVDGIRVIELYLVVAQCTISFGDILGTTWSVSCTASETTFMKTPFLHISSGSVTRYR